MAALIILTGPPGAGKTTLARELARRYDRAVHLPTDGFWHVIVSGGIPPYEPASAEQNEVVLDVIAGAAWTYAAGGFTTVVDGVVGPWMLHHFLSADRPRDVPVPYVVLRPDRETALRRAQQRTAPDALTDPGPVAQMWDQFADLGALEGHVLDTSHLDLDASLAAVVDAVDGRRGLIAGTDPSPTPPGP